MDPNQLTQKWLALSTNGVFDRSDPFLRFITAWLAFNSVYSSVFPTVAGDRRQVLEFAADQAAQGAHSLLLQNAPHYVQAIAVLTDKGVRDVRTGRRRNISAQTNLEELLDCV